jgi:hypothetical protein
MSDAISPNADETSKTKRAARDKEAPLRVELSRVTELANRALLVAAAAVVVALLSPLWSPWLFKAVGGSDAGSARVLVIAVEQLRPALASSSPFDRQLALVRKMMAGDREVIRALDQLAPSAESGVPTAGVVRRGFMAAANRVFVAEVLHIEPDDRWVNKAMVIAASTVRPHDVARTFNIETSGPARTIIAIAAQRLADDDLSGAIQAVESLPHSYAPLTASWLAEARQREAAARGWAALEALVVSRLGTPR